MRHERRPQGGDAADDDVREQGASFQIRSKAGQRHFDPAAFRWGGASRISQRSRRVVLSISVKIGGTESVSIIDNCGYIGYRKNKGRSVRSRAMIDSPGSYILAYKVINEVQSLARGDWKLV